MSVRFLDRPTELDQETPSSIGTIRFVLHITSTK
jgi:hypothetical protein